MAVISRADAVWTGDLTSGSGRVKRAADRVEYAETGARYEYLNLMAGEIGEGLSPEEIRAISQAFVESSTKMT